MNRLTCIYLALLTTVAYAQAQLPKTSGTNTTEATSPPKEFRFNGGSFRDFTRKLADHFGTNILDVLEVRGEEAYRLQIPKMRQSYSPARSTDWSFVLKLYNQISEEGNGFLGKWIFNPKIPQLINDGSQTRAEPPQTLVFVPPQPAAAEGGAIQVRAFPILRFTKERQKELIHIIEEESQQMQHDIRSGQLPAGQDIFLAQGRLSIHQDTGLLIAVGGRAYVELVKTVVDAFMINYPSLRELRRQQ